MSHFSLVPLLLVMACGFSPGGGVRSVVPVVFEPRPAPSAWVQQHPECEDAWGEPLVPVMVQGTTGLSCEMRCAPHTTVGYSCTDLEDFIFIRPMVDTHGREVSPRWGKTREVTHDPECPGSYRIWRLSATSKLEQQNNLLTVAGSIEFANEKSLLIAGYDPDADRAGDIERYGTGSDCRTSPVLYDWPKAHPGLKWLSAWERMIPELGR